LEDSGYAGGEGVEGDEGYGGVEHAAECAGCGDGAVEEEDTELYEA
jgi:hypothetical protein